MRRHLLLAISTALVMVGCSETPQIKPGPQAILGEWVLDGGSFEGTALAPGFGSEPPRFVFDRTGSFTAQGECFTFEGRFEFTSEVLFFSDSRAIQLGCPGGTTVIDDAIRFVLTNPILVKFTDNSFTAMTWQGTGLDMAYHHATRAK